MENTPFINTADAAFGTVLGRGDPAQTVTGVVEVLGFPGLVHQSTKGVLAAAKNILLKCQLVKVSIVFGQ